MKPFILALVAVAFTGCAYLSSHTQTPVYAAGSTNIIGYATTDMRIYTFFDASNNVTKARNSNGGPTNAWDPGTVVSGVNEASSGQSIVAIINAAAKAASAAGGVP